ncbi:MAG: TetR family transcriptional regulator [Novosphingobium sp.]|nr:TetR family transcriptional regulator [Novosphingobium sp.]
MTKSGRAADSRAVATRRLLIDAGERLFAGHGVDGVSVRQLGIAIGAANPNVVNYHFGGKPGLVQAIVQHRLPAIDARRKALLDRIERRDGVNDLSELLDALYRPFLEQTDQNGRHSYVAFLWGLYRSDQMDLRLELSAAYPATNALVAGIRRAVPAMSAQDFERRFGVATAMIAAALANIDHRCRADGEAERRFADVIAMVEAAFRAPIAPILNEREET